MKFKQIGTYSGDIVRTTLENRGIEDFDSYSNPEKPVQTNLLDLKGATEGVGLFLANLLLGEPSEQKPIGILVDPDADGYTSSSIMYQGIKEITPDRDLLYFMHEDKKHGLSDKIMEDIAATDIEFLIIPDAGSNDIEKIKQLQTMGIQVLVIDHHESELQEPVIFLFDNIILNNQYDDTNKVNKKLVGAGMVYKFLESVNAQLKEPLPFNYLDLVSVGQIGDASDVSDPEIRYLVESGLKDIRNPFIKEVLSETGKETFVPKDLSFSIIPLINAVARVGTQEEKSYLFQALNSIDPERTFTVKKKKKNRTTGKFDTLEIEMNLYQYVHDLCKKVKNRQASEVKKTLTKLTGQFDDSGQILVGVIDPPKNGSVTGLIANKIASKHSKPTLIIHQEAEGSYIGSGRGNLKVMKSLKDWCNETDLVEYAQGHANAFGIKIHEEKLKPFKKEIMKIETSEFIHEVDVIEEGQPNPKKVLHVHNNRHLFLGKVSEPLVAFHKVDVPKAFIRQRGSMLTFYTDGVEFIFYSAPPGLFDTIKEGFASSVSMTFIGYCGVNSWGSKESPQVVLRDAVLSENATNLSEEDKEPVIEEAVVPKMTAEELVF